MAPRYGEPVKIHGGVTGTTVLTVLSIALTACGGSDSKVSVDKLQKAADAAVAAPANPCPLGFDVNAALKKAKVAGTATPTKGTDSGAKAVDADSATSASADSALKQFGGAMITCTYTLSGGGSLEATVTGVQHPKAINLLAPLLQRDGHIASSDLTTVITQKLTAGKAVLTPGGGLAAIDKIDASGGDAILEVTTTADDPQTDHGPLMGEPLRELTETLGKQVRV